MKQHQRLVQHTGQKMSAKAQNPLCWRGHPVRLVDGTTVTMPDTLANQVH